MASAWSAEKSEFVGMPTPTATSLPHQADHTVKYVIGVMPPTPTRTPIGFMSIPTPVPNPASVIPASVPTAVVAWNRAVATPWPYVLFCEHGAKNDCLFKNPVTQKDEDRNSDGKTTTVSAVRYNTGSPDDPTNNPRVGCGLSIACVKFMGSASPHRGEMALAIEEPAWQYIKDMNKHIRVYWTNVKSDGATAYPLRDGVVTYYLPSIVMHEFGHTAGLPDIAGATPHSGLMKNPYGNKTLQQDDISDLDRHYRGHKRH